ncbi:hypothetical protein FB45DRAFT_794964 [Roridomyces roridus]|uniref:GATA-type domain-containing protein n=1 Tax=Roridomyces roridus TaxID=1738132 RepID=A0AAD7BS64_9AGAR|nr:hypothetical protein FB45DRAFT_794964 [Roridomyces roridus]
MHTPHSLLFNSIVDREIEDNSRTTSPSLSSSRTSPAVSMLRTTSLYWAPDCSPPSSASSATSAYATAFPGSFPGAQQQYNRQQRGATPSIDLTGLIPIHDSSRFGRGPIPELGTCDNDYQWSPPNMAAHYNGAVKSAPSSWHPPADGDLSTSQQCQWVMAAQQFTEYTTPYPPSSPYPTSASSSSASASVPSSPYYLTPPHTSAPLPTLPSVVPHAHVPRRAAAQDDPNVPKKSCSHCHVTSTPLWRRDPSTHRVLCNACGLYLQQRNKLRPQELIDADLPDSDSDSGPPDESYEGPRCSHCNTRQTSVWRRSKTGAQVCNACGVYARLRGRDRPLSLKRTKIKPRTKHSKQ